MKRTLITAAFTIAMTTGATAQEMTQAAEICSDPMTTGPQKITMFEFNQWVPVTGDENGNLLDLATAHIMGFTNSATDKNGRYDSAPVLAGNFARMAAAGQVTLWGKSDSILAISIAQTPEGGEHLACYLATLPTDETTATMDSYGGPEQLPEIDLTVLQFNETAFNARDDVTYKMYSTWSRQSADPARTPLTDAYRLERVEQVQPQ